MPQTEPSGSHRHIEDVDLQLLRGAYQIEGVRVAKTGGKQPVTFFSASLVDLSVQWGALLDGAIVVQDLVPFSINRFSIAGGEVHYRDFESDPQVDIYLQDLNAEARNLTNSEERSGRSWRGRRLVRDGQPATQRLHRSVA